MRTYNCRHIHDIQGPWRYEEFQSLLRGGWRITKKARWWHYDLYVEWLALCAR